MQLNKKINKRSPLFFELKEWHLKLPLSDDKNEQIRSIKIPQVRENTRQTRRTGSFLKRGFMSTSCHHPGFFHLPEDFACEVCYDIFASCNEDEFVPKTPEHSKICKSCTAPKGARKKPKFSVVAEEWKQQLGAFDNPSPSRKKRAKG